MTTMKTVFLETDFILLLVTSVVAPVAIYAYLFTKNAIARFTVLIFASILIALSGVDVILLKLLGHAAKTSLSPFDDKLFNSEISVTLFLLPALFAGIGINLVSHVLIDHIKVAERQFDNLHSGKLIAFQPEPVDGSL
jgi:hypothetical protein